jgi:hypothetical protein
VTLSARESLQQAHSVLFMALKTKEGWLVRKRLAHPMFGKVGFVHGEPIATESITTTASKIFEAKTGLSVDFTVAGSGYVRLLKDDALESFTHFTLLYAESYTGSLADKVEKHPNGQNYWLDTINDKNSDLIPGMEALCAKLDSTDRLFFEELEFHI